MTITPKTSRPQLIDGMGRTIVNLRISVTDRCNFRCTYCMPADNVEFMDRSNLLSFEEIKRVAQIVSSMGINRLRLTGGEPLIRKDIHNILSELGKLNLELAITTNGVLVNRFIDSFKNALIVLPPK